jgi:hypothetical protein
MASYLLGSFPDDAALCAAARALRAQGYPGLDAHSPVPVHGIDEALGLKRSAVPLIGLLGGLAGTSGGLLMEWWMNAVDYPLNIGGRSMLSVPAWIPVAFETTVLLASVSIVLGLFGLAGFPRPHHPVFEVDAFRSASVDTLWLSVQVPGAQAEAAAAELRRLGAVQVERVDEGEDE